MANSFIPATQVSPGDGSGTPSATGLGLVENTALSTWAGSVNITTLGTVTTGSFPAANLAGTTLPASVVTSSLTTLGSLLGITMDAGAQILTPSAVTPGSPNLSFVGDGNTGIYHAAADAIGFATNGVGVGLVNQLGAWLLGQITDNGTGSPLQVTGGIATGLEATGYGGTGNVYMRLAAGTAGAATPTTTAQIARIGLRGIDTAGSTTYSLGGNLEITPTGTWSGTDHGTTIALWTTPSGSTTRSAVLTIDGSQNTTIANTTKGAFQSAGTATSCTGATIGTGSKANAGFVTATTTGVSTVVITFPFTSATGWVVRADNLTTANVLRQTASSTTTATFVGTTVTGDVISYIAMAY